VNICTRQSSPCGHGGERGRGSRRGGGAGKGGGIGGSARLGREREKKRGKAWAR